MRRLLFVVAIATLLLPSVLAAQPQEADSKEAAHVANPPPTATPGNHASSRSLMGMVMGALIQSAEQQSTSNEATGQRDSGKRDLGKRDLGKRDPDKAKPAASGADPAARTKPATEKIAVQSEP
jgi:hypothetical protein